MRLSQKEIKAITEAFSTCLSGVKYVLYLFGSRVDKNKKGGDIDLLCVVDLHEKENVVNLKPRIKNEIFKIIPDQKIDITIAVKEEFKTNVFLQSVLSGAVVLDSCPVLD